MPMTTNDYREVGLGQITGTATSSPPSGSNQDTQPMISTTITNPTPSTSKKRVANQPIETSKPKKTKKKKSKRNHEKDAHDKEKSATTMRKNYEQIAEKLKGAIKRKDKSWLCNLVHAKTSDASKRILLSKLIEDNHAHISKELAAIRFAKPIQEAEKSVTERLEDEANEIVDFQHLPHELFIQIEEFVKKEIPEAAKVPEADDDIVEVPVPPKPAPDLVTLDEDESILTPLRRLKSLAEDESLLYDQLERIEKERKAVCDKIEKIRQIRAQILTEMME